MSRKISWLPMLCLFRFFDWTDLFFFLFQDLYYGYLYFGEIKNSAHISVFTHETLTIIYTLTRTYTLKQRPSYSNIVYVYAKMMNPNFQDLEPLIYWEHLPHLLKIYFAFPSNFATTNIKTQTRLIIIPYFRLWSAV